MMCICIKCGSRKRGHLHKCQACAFKPTTSQDIAKALYLSRGVLTEEQKEESRSSYPKTIQRNICCRSAGNLPLAFRTNTTSYDLASFWPRAKLSAVLTARPCYDGPFVSSDLQSPFLLDSGVSFGYSGIFAGRSNKRLQPIVRGDAPSGWQESTDYRKNPLGSHSHDFSMRGSITIRRLLP